MRLCRLGFRNSESIARLTCADMAPGGKFLLLRAIFFAFWYEDVDDVSSSNTDLTFCDSCPVPLDFGFWFLALSFSGRL